MKQERRDRYVNPLCERYASEEMLYNFSDDRKFGLWRRLWVALAEAQRELGLPITAAQIREMKKHQDKINYDVAAKREREVRHDVMAHVYAFGVQCPRARGIIHLGATSAFVQDNTDLIQMRDGLDIIRRKLANAIDLLGKFAEEHRAMPTLAFTHYQPAQLTTVGKRACLWIQDIAMDLEEIERVSSNLRFRGVKGTTGTQASFLALFNGDETKVKKLEALVARKMGFDKVFPVTGQTYPRKADWQVLSALCGVALSAHKFANDMRLLHNLREIEEPFEKKQIGSSAMAYKRNPMRCERMTALSRFVIASVQNAAMTAAEQWFERTLDDSANRRIAIPEVFLAVDGILEIYLNVVSGMRVFPRMIEQHVARELPFMATEVILMECVKSGGDRQELHEKLRRHSLAALRRIREEGKSGDLLQRIRSDPAFAPIRDRLEEILEPRRFVGRAPNQVSEFIRSVVNPIRKKYRSVLGMRVKLKV